MSIKDRRPSPALFVAIIALVAALGGTAVALPGKGSVDKNDLAKNVVKSKNIAKGAVKSSDIKNDGVKGIDIDESSLAQVPSAAQANSAANADAVGGVRVVAISAFLPDNTTPTPVLNVGGLTITATCVNGGNVDPLIATTSAANAFIVSSSQDHAGEDIDNGVTNSSFDPSDEVDLASDGFADEETFTTYFDDGTGAAGAQVTANYTAGSNDGSADGGCYVIGSAEVQ